MMFFLGEIRRKSFPRRTQPVVETVLSEAAEPKTNGVVNKEVEVSSGEGANIEEEVDPLVLAIHQAIWEEAGDWEAELQQPRIKHYGFISYNT
jgi:hypothetical protein